MVNATLTDSSAPHPQQSTILVVDDFPENLSILSSILDENNYQVQAAISGELALQAVKHRKPDLILLDIRMPGINGFDVCRQLKAESSTKEIPVILITGLNDEYNLVEGFRVGAVDYITKPFKVDEVLARVNNQINLHHLQKSLIAQNKELQETRRTRDELQEIILHDLKGPLVPILSFPGLIRKNNHLTDRERKFLQTIEKAGYRIKDLISQLTAIHKSQQGLDALTVTSVDIFEQIRLLIDSAHGEIDRKDLNLALLCNQKPIATNESFYIEGDQWLISSMLDNLIRNAVEASRHRDQIKIDIHTTSPCIITIHNQLPVPAHLRASFFDRDNSFGKESGVGLGTYVAKMVAEFHQGSIEMCSDEENGTAVTVTLPVRQTLGKEKM